MIRKDNLPFIAVLGALAVAFIVALVLVHGTVSAKSKANRELKALRDEYENLTRKDASQKHQDAVQEQVKQANTNFQALKEQLLLWWDGDVYNEQVASRQPVPFLGQLQDLRSQIRTFAEGKKVLLAQGVENLGFIELHGSTPPLEVTFDLIRQRSVMRDIMALLINNKVETIDSITWLGKAKGGDLYDKYLVTIQFTCKYPSLAKFQSDLVNTTKVSVPPFGDCPHNLFVIESLAYATEDQKAAEMAAAAAAAKSGAATTGTTGTGTRRAPTTGSYGGHMPPGATGREAIDPYHPGATIRQPTGGGSMGVGSTMPGRTPDTVTRRRTEEKRPDIPGRMPAYNILTVQMTIAMVDFSEEITGKIPALEEEKKKNKKTTTSTRSTEGQPAGNN